MYHTQNLLDKNQTTEFLHKTRTLDLKMQKEINISRPNQQKTWMQVLPAK